MFHEHFGSLQDAYGWQCFNNTEGSPCTCEGFRFHLIRINSIVALVIKWEGSCTCSVQPAAGVSYRI